MQLPHPFYEFPFQFDAERMRAEIEAIPESCWRWHHEGFEGNSALPLISTEGGMNDAFDAPMMRTEFLDRMPYVMQVLAHFKTLLGRARLMRIEPRAGVPPHVDIQYYWRTHTRVHIPVVTHPGIRFHCGNESVHMAAGEAWTFDNWRQHKVVNDTDTRRIHLTFDTFGSTAFWSMARPRGQAPARTFTPFAPEAKPKLVLETYVGPPALSPSELEIEFARFVQDAASHPRADRRIVAELDRLLYALRNEWKMLWHSRGPCEESIPVFAALLARVSSDIFAMVPPNMQMGSNGSSARQVLESIFTAMLRAPKEAPARMLSPSRIDRPVFIVSAPRSGSTLLFERLARSEDLWTLGGEGHGHIESIAALAPEHRGFESNRLTAEDATAEIVARLRANYEHNLRNANGVLLRDLDGGAPASARFLEKTPKNALRIPFLKAVFPDAKFVFLHRSGPANVGSIVEAWRSGGFVTYPRLEGWRGPPWSLLLVPGWRNLNGESLAVVAARQWEIANRIILRDLEALSQEDWRALRYEDLIESPSSTLEALSAFIGVRFGPGLRAAAANSMALSRYTVSAPDPDKWRRNEAEILAALSSARDLAEALRALPRLGRSTADAAAVSLAGPN